MLCLPEKGTQGTPADLDPRETKKHSDVPEEKSMNSSDFTSVDMSCQRLSGEKSPRASLQK
jgi:hypothetical protein